MPITTEGDLPSNARTLWLKAHSAVELRNFGYAISLLLAVLKESPGFLEARKVLRRAEIANTKGKKSFLSGLSTASLKGAGMVKKDPVAAMELAEKTLESDPFNRNANDLLKDAARAAGYPEIACFALETLVEGNPKDVKILHELAEAYSAMGESDHAVRVYTKITEINPADLVAVKRSKDASANATIKKGGWQEATSYRDLMKNQAESVSLEEKNRVFKDAETIDRQLSELSAQYEQAPDNIDTVRKIANLYEQRHQNTDQAEDLTNALQWYQYTSDLAKGSDPAVTRKLSDLTLKQKDMRIKELADWFESGGHDHPDAATYQEELETLKKERADSLISEAKKRVDRNPTDLNLRYELGERLLAAGNYNDAIPELQKARQSPNVRLKAMALLGRCFVLKGMFDMAATQFETAASEMTAMDATKKETLYDLALLYEKMGQKEKYIKCIKDIAEVDYTYKDVAGRIERFYTGDAAA